MSRDVTEKISRSCDVDTKIAFTHGSCMGNPGPYGSGACVFFPEVTDPVYLKKPVCKQGSVLFGRAGFGCSKLRTSLVNVSLEFQTLINLIRQYLC